MSSRNSLPGSLEYLHGEGVILTTDMNSQLLDRLATLPIERLPPEIDGEYSTLVDRRRGLYPSNIVLSIISNQLSEQVLSLPNPSTEECDWFNMSQAEKDRAKPHIIGAGARDLDFPWYFSASLASAAMHEFVGAGKVNQNVAANLTLGDWANMIGSDWFSALTHSSAYAQNGTWGRFGTNLDDYARGAFTRHLVTAIGDAKKLSWEGIKVLDVGEKEEPDGGDVHLAASLNPQYQTVLRKTMERPYIGRSPGCLGARRGAKLPSNFEELTPRAAMLVELGQFLIINTDPDSSTVLVTQQESAAARTLTFIASQLRRYDELYGTPQLLTYKGRAMVHTRKPPSNALLRSKS